MCWEFLAAFAVGWIWGVVFVCAKPMLDLTSVIRSPFFVPVTGGQPFGSSVGRF